MLALINGSFRHSVASELAFVQVLHKYQYTEETNSSGQAYNLAKKISL